MKAIGENKKHRKREDEQMNVAQLAEQLRRDNQFMKDVTRWEVIPAREAKTAPFPDNLDPRLIPVLA